LSPFRDSFRNDIWQEFAEPSLADLGLSGPRSTRNRGNFVRMTSPFGFPLEVKERRRGQKKHDSANLTNGQFVKDRTQLNPDEYDIDDSQIFGCKPSKALKKRNKHGKKNSTSSERNKADSQARIKPKFVVNANANKVFEHQESSEESSSGNEDDLKRAKAFSQTWNCSKSTVEEEQLPENDEINIDSEKKESKNETIIETSPDEVVEGNVQNNDREDEKEEDEEEDKEPSEKTCELRNTELIKTKLDAINTELTKARELKVRVSSFNGNKEDKEYLCLEELLLRCILNLDLVDSEGYEEVKATRRAAVKEIQKFISELEAKVKDS